MEKNKKIKAEKLWFNWLNNKWNNFEAFNDFSSGKNPETVAQNFFEINKNEILDFLENFDKEDEDAFNQFQKLTECESHVFRLLKKELDSRNKVKFVDFQKFKKSR